MDIPLYLFSRHRAQLPWQPDPPGPLQAPAERRREPPHRGQERRVQHQSEGPAGEQGPGTLIVIETIVLQFL